MDYLTKRLDLLERVSKIQASLPPGPAKEIIDAEVEQYRVLFSRPSNVLQTRQHKDNEHSQSRFARFFSTAPATSIKRRIYKGLFYFFFGCAVIVLFVPLGLLNAKAEFDWSDLIVGFLVTFCLLPWVGARFPTGHKGSLGDC